MEDRKPARAPLPTGGSGTAQRSATISSDDFDEIAAALAGWDHRFEQLDAGRFSGRVTVANLDGVQLFDVALNRRIAARGGIPPDSLVVSPVLESNVGAVWRGRPLGLGAINLIGPGMVMDHRTAPAYRNTSLVVGSELLHRAASLFGFEEALPALTRRHDLRVGARGCAALHREIVDALGALSASPPGASTPRDASAVVERALRRLLLVASAGLDPEPPAPRWDRRYRVVRRAEDYMRAHLDRPISILDLCAEVGVSERTLHYAFREITGLTPKAYLKASRLNQLRRGLRQADPRRETVQGAAARWGFTHPGELAADYRRQFGELPSQAMGKASRRT